jgi:hypothetical protein
MPNWRDIHGCGRSLRGVLQVFPKDVPALQQYVHVLGWLVGKPDAAAPLAARLVDLDPLSAMSLLVSAMVPLICRAAWRADRAEVLRPADGPYQQAAAWDAEIPWVLASAHAAVGAKEEALVWLDRAIDRGMINYPFLSEHDRYLDNVRGDARFGRVSEFPRGFERATSRLATPV